MATLYSAVAAKQNSPSGKTPLDARDVLPEFKRVRYTYTFTGLEAADDIIRIVKLPPGCRIQPRNCEVYGDAVAGTATITVGDYSAVTGLVLDADRYSTALNVAAAGWDVFTGGLAEATPFETTVETWITATLATLATPVAGKKLDFYLAFTINGS
jgi:hypothetical protein